MIVSVRGVSCMLLGLSAVGCSPEDSDLNRAASAPRRSARESAQLVARSSEGRRERPASTAKPTGLGTDNRITGCAPWNTGRVTSPAPKVTEQTTRVWGKAMSAGGGSLSITVDGGAARNFRTDENTFIGRAGDKHFHPYPGGLEGIQAGVGVSVQFYQKNGQEYASWIAVGAEPFAQTGTPTTKTE